MNVPSGYSALDLVGFTDRGAYDPNANYVKNDLVHDSRKKIWKCKVDDTTGVTPAAGAYWDLFIDSSESLTGMSDTDISSPTNGQALFYNSTKEKWENKVIGYVDGERAIIGAV